MSCQQWELETHLRYRMAEIARWRDGWATVPTVDGRPTARWGSIRERVGLALIRAGAALADRSEVVVRTPSLLAAGADRGRSLAVGTGLRRTSFHP